MLLSLLLLWPVLCQRVGERRRVLLNTALACAATFIILYATILNRTPGNYELILTPFAALSAARQQPELYREMLMNIFLFFPLGLTLSNALPRKWHRWLRIILTTLVGCALSADDDLLIPDGEFFACHEQLLANGLTTDTPADELATADEVSYTKEGSPLYIELHRHLFDSAEDAHDELNHFFTDLNPVETDGFLAMPPHEHLLYLILHAYKHFVRSGIGLRQFCDIGLWAREYHAEIDWRRLHDQCVSVHAATFAAASFRIARDDLGIEFDLPMPWDASIDVEPLLHDTLCGGVYGSNDLTRLHSSTVTLNAVKASRTGEKSGILRTVFPKREYLERRYPYLKKRPYLLPVAWAQRIAHYASEKQSGADNSASGSIKLGKERIELMKRYGIMD